MRIPIRVSDLMDSKSRCLGSLEDCLIRMPAELRDVCGADIGGFVNLRRLDGEMLSLRVSKTYVPDVDSDPLSAYVTQNVFEGLNLSDIKKKHLQEIDVIDGITLGCDPELFLVSRFDGRLICPTEMKFLRSGEVGSDGMMLEVRPIPSTSEWVVAHNIWTCLRRARLMLDKVKKPNGKTIAMVAASQYKQYTAGFHLHFGIPKELRGGVEFGEKYHFRNQIGRVLDYYVGIVSILPEGEHDNIRRSSVDTPYGKPGEWRQKGVTFEYRVPGGYMLRHPVLAVGLIGLGAIVVEDALSRMAACTDNFKNLGVLKHTSDLKEIYPNIPDVFELYKTVTATSIKPARAYLDTILSDITKMVGFDKRKKSVERMFKCIYDGTSFRPDIEDSWRLFYNEKQQRSMDVLSA